MRLVFPTTVTWRRKTGSDPYEGDTYQDQTIQVRWEADRALVRSPTGDEVVSEARVFTADPVATGDVLIGEDLRPWPVIGTSRIQDLHGRTSHYEVRL